MVTVNIQAAPATLSAQTSPMDVSLTLPTEFFSRLFIFFKSGKKPIDARRTGFHVAHFTSNPGNIPRPPSPLPSTEQIISYLLNLYT